MHAGSLHQSGSPLCKLRLVHSRKNCSVRKKKESTKCADEHAGYMYIARSLTLVFLDEVRVSEVRRLAHILAEESAGTPLAWWAWPGPPEGRAKRLPIL